MDFLNRAWGQLSERFRAMTPGGRIATAGMALAVVASLLYLARSQNAASELYLMNGEHFAASELQAMEAAFAAAGLNSYEVEGNRIRVPRGQQPVYMAALVEKNALPSNYFEWLSRAVNGSPFEDRHQREKRIEVEKQKVLSMIIGAMPGNERAVVLWDAETRPGSLKAAEKTASVMVKPAAGRELSEAQVASIRNLVVGAVAGLKKENVAVTDLAAVRTFCGGPDGAVGADDAYIARKRTHEQEWSRKIQTALAYVPGATVAANVELDRERIAPQRVSATVAIPSGYFDKVWRERHQAAAAEGKSPPPGELAEIRAAEIGKIERCVAQLLPGGEPNETARRVTVTEFQDIAPPPLPEPDPRQEVLAWLRLYWQPAALTVLGLLSVLVLRSLLKLPAAGGAEATAGASAAPAPAGQGASRDELSQMVTQRPEQAAEILRQWIGAAS